MILTIRFTTGLTTGLMDITEPTKDDKRGRNRLFGWNITNNRSGFVNIVIFDGNGAMLIIPNDSESYLFFTRTQMLFPPSITFSAIFRFYALMFLRQYQRHRGWEAMNVNFC